MPDTSLTPPQLALTIVIPVYNGATSVAELVAALERLTIDGGHEIVRGVKLDRFATEKVAATVAELEKERDLVKDLLT